MPKVYKGGELPMDYVSRQKFEVMSQKEFRAHHGGLSLSALDYLMDRGVIDYVRLPNRFRVIVMTPRTKEYQPLPNVRRAKMAVMET